MVDTSGTESGCRPLHFAAQLVLAPEVANPLSNLCDFMTQKMKKS